MAPPSHDQCQLNERLVVILECLPLSAARAAMEALALILPLEAMAASLLLHCYIPLLSPRGALLPPPPSLLPSLLPPFSPPLPMFDRSARQLGQIIVDTIIISRMAISLSSSSPHPQCLHHPPHRRQVPPYRSHVLWEPPPWWPKHHAKQLLLKYHQARLPFLPTQAIGIWWSARALSACLGANKVN
jgi:hypothetical protein